MAGNAPAFGSSELRLTAKQALFSVAWPRHAMKRLLRRGGWLMTDNTETWSLSNRVNREAATLPLLLAWTRRAKSVVLSKRYPK